MDPSVSMTEAAREKLRQIVERVERLEEEKKEIAEQIKEVFAEAKSMGFDVSALRKIISDRRKDARELEEQEMIEDLYRGAVGMSERRRGIPMNFKMPGM